MRAFFQLFKLEFLSAVRSKTIHLFTLACTLWMVLGRYFLKGGEDGVYQLSARYLLGTVFCVVLTAFGSGAAGVISRDRVEKRLQLTLIRPLHRYLIALARSLALAAIGSGMLFLALALLWAFDGRSRTCDTVYAPALESPREEAEKMFQELYKAKEEFRLDVEKVGKREILKYLESLAREKYVTVAPGKTAYWEFLGVPRNINGAKVRVRFDDSWGRVGSISGVFAFRNLKGDVSDPVRAVSFVELNQVSENSSPSNRLVFANSSNASLSLQPRNDLNLLVPADGFEWNALRAWLMMSLSLLSVVSLGVFLGSCLGRGVAVFALISLLCVMVVSPATMDEYPDPVNADFVSRLSVRLTEFSSYITSPINRFSPVSSLQADEYISWTDVGNSAVTAVLSLVLFSLTAGLIMPKKGDV